MMKFLKKQALVGTSYCIAQYEAPSDLVNTNTTPSYSASYFAKIIKQIIDWFKQKSHDSHALPPDLNRYANIINWATLIKTPTRTSKTRDDKIDACIRNDSLCGRFVLCVGGRIRLYPIYERLINHYGGHLITFHGDSSNLSSNLPQLLREVDMIICPVDCVNHDNYLTVKNYCQHSGKPCVLLDRSEAKTFAAGVNMLSHMAALKSRKH